MHFISDTETYKAMDLTIGGKAKNLFRLKNLGMPVPRFVVIPWESLVAKLPDPVRNGSDEAMLHAIEQIVIDCDLILALTKFFAETRYFAVRSSAVGEDGGAFSFAGQLESHLYVTRQQMAVRIKDVWRSAFSARVSAYRQHHGISGLQGIAVIVQEMVEAESAGVAFGANPVTGNRDEKVINAVFGIGEGLVSGELNADQFVLKGTDLHIETAHKTQMSALDLEHGAGTVIQDVPTSNQHKPALTDDQVRRIGGMLDQLEKAFGQPQDIEFAIANDQLYLLQTRPITTLNAPGEVLENYILWDNSNIIESYPGVTTPLTFSFISKSYETAYKLFSAYLGVGQAVIKANERVFANTLGFLNGRVYYNLKSWYHMLAMLPGYSLNARFMEKMMGVKEQFDIPESYRLSRAKAWWRIVKMAVQMLFRFMALPRKRKEFMALVDGMIREYKAIPFAEKDAAGLMQLYLRFEQKLLLEWKAPLLNDFFAMIWFGMLQKQCEQAANGGNTNLHNDLLCGSNDIISVQPVHRSIEIAARIADIPALKVLFVSQNEFAIHEALLTSTDPQFAAIQAEIDRYIADFGERCVGELKLETVSYSQEPAKFVRVLKSYVETGITAAQISGSREEAIRADAEKELRQHLKGKLVSQWKMRVTLRYTRELVSARENLRYERTRAFGIVRELFTAIGKRFHTDGLLTDARHIFYLTKEEIFSYIDGTAVTQDIKALIALRKKEFQSYNELGPLSERFATYGVPYHGNDFFNIDRVEAHQGDLKGIGCSPGKVSGKVKVVLDPGEISSLNGDILVTSSTDPGWVTLFPGALGIIVERGSLLSHSAIVSREMGKPCIVGVTGLLRRLKTGDRIEMDGSTGIISMLGE
ncbi:phosphoenolpyruvate synthase [Dyadobacter sp. CY261]|uniref:PEP/pyruvate-binding domain-containing protein n=1 Tax=Dyadobacter sp. CY261 TaxID=2907203 RepID=UPI001F29814B|nr:PEP/pyruvate-binding domain-containing protein [Dyadobacter sp. CY261]MCF0069470.1 phosphoenolpyruvate synthase [Dyadobacter sp. CY261]